jgi:hypothetical protein
MYNLDRTYLGATSCESADDEGARTPVFRSSSLAIVIILWFLLADVTPATAQTVTGTCLPNDSTAARLVDFFRAVLKPESANDTALRGVLGLSTVTPAQVSVVLSAPICDSAATAVNTIITTKRRNYPLYVISLGSSYGVAFAPDGSPGPEFAYVFDANWHLVELIQTL